MKALNKTTKFLVFTFVISYSLAIVYGIVRGGNVNNDRLGFTIMGVVYMFVPFVSALIVRKINKEPLLSNLSISFKINRWFFVSLLIFPIIVFCSIGVSVMLPGISYNPEMTGMFSRFDGLMPP